MKTTLILALAFGIQLSTLVASNIGNDGIPPETNEFLCPECPMLAPTVPMEAPFEEIGEFIVPKDLSPVVPTEAPFVENVEFELAAPSFAPVVPLQADFHDVVLPKE